MGRLLEHHLAAVLRAYDVQHVLSDIVEPPDLFVTALI